MLLSPKQFQKNPKFPSSLLQLTSTSKPDNRIKRSTATAVRKMRSKTNPKTNLFQDLKQKTNNNDIFLQGPLSFKTKDIKSQKPSFSTKMLTLSLLYPNPPTNICTSHKSQFPSRLEGSKIGYERCSIQQSRSGVTDTDKKHPESQIFHLYKPQVLHISPRSKVRIFSTINLTQSFEKKSPKKNPSPLIPSFVKPTLINQKSPEDTKPLIREPIGYVKPAMTFGEKLWRLNEVSIFSMINK